MADIGHNSGNVLQFESLKDRADTLVNTANRWLKERPEITSEDLAGKCSDFVEQLTKHEKACETARKNDKQPHIDAGKAVDEQYKPLSSALEMAKKLLKSKLTPWLQKKETERLAAIKKAEEDAMAKIEEAEAEALSEPTTVQEAMKAESAEADAEAALKRLDRIARMKATVQGDLGSRARGLKTRKEAVVSDYAKALNHYRDNAEVVALIQRLAQADVRHGETSIPGVEIKEIREAA